MVLSRLRCKQGRDESKRAAAGKCEVKKSGKRRTKREETLSKVPREAERRGEAERQTVVSQSTSGDIFICA